MKNINGPEWVSLLESDKNAIVIDARTSLEWQEGVQENAVLLDVMQTNTFEQAVQKFDKSKNYYVYCRSGQRSQGACAMLEAAGISNTFNLVGGMMSWTGKTVVPNM